MKNKISFLDAQSRASYIAHRLIYGTIKPSGLGLERINARKRSEDWTDEEHRIMVAILNQVKLQTYKKVLTKYITSGRVRDCILSRKFMSSII